MNRPEPAVIAHVVASALAVLVAFAVPGFSVETNALIMALFNAGAALYTAWKVNATTLALVMGVVNAGFALLSGYGLNLAEGQQTALVALLSVVIGLFIRNGAEPLPTPSLSLKTGTG